MKAGQNHTLTVTRISDYGLYLADQEGQEVLLPNRYVSLADKVGDAVDVFVYHDSEDRLVATRETPLARAGEAAFLKVVDKNLHGAFLDWGLAGKDLFLPNRNQQGGIFAGRSYVVYVYVDDVTGRCVATNKLKSFVNNETLTVRPRAGGRPPVRVGKAGCGRAFPNGGCRSPRGNRSPTPKPPADRPPRGDGR